MEYGSYPAIVACTAVGAQEQVAVHELPAKVASARTMLIWRKGHQSSPLDALRQELGRGKH